MYLTKYAMWRQSSERMSGTVTAKCIQVRLKSLREGYGLSAILYFWGISVLIPMEPNHQKDDSNNSNNDVLLFCYILLTERFSIQFGTNWTLQKQHVFYSQEER